MDITLLRESEIDLKVAIADVQQEIEDRVQQLSDLLDQLRANQAEQRRLKSGRARRFDDDKVQLV